MLDIAIIPGSVRPNRLSPKVAAWVFEVASKRDDARFEVVDIAAYDLPLYDEPFPPSADKEPAHEHTKVWSWKIDAFDAYIFVTPEYDHGIPAPLKNALDYLYKEWNNKACGFVGFGSVGGVRSIEQLRQVVALLQMADVASELNFKLRDDFDAEGNFTPRPAAENLLNRMIDQVIAWGTALKPLRNP